MYVAFLYLTYVNVDVSGKQATRVPVTRVPGTVTEMQLNLDQLLLLPVDMVIPGTISTLLYILYHVDPNDPTGNIG